MFKKKDSDSSAQAKSTASGSIPVPVAVGIIAVAFAVVFFVFLKPMLFSGGDDYSASQSIPAPMPTATNPADSPAPPAPNAAPPADTQTESAPVSAAAPPAAKALPVPSAGEILVYGVVKSIAGESKMVVETNRIQLGGQAEITLDPARTKEIRLGKVTLPSGISVGAKVAVVGPNLGVGKPLTARELTLQ